MAILIKIYLKDKSEKNINHFNNILKNTQFAFNDFISKSFMKSWADDINSNPNSPQAHLKPITTDNLINLFKPFKEVGAMSVEIPIAKNNKPLINNQFYFIEKYKDHIQNVKIDNNAISTLNLNKKYINLINEINQTHI